MSHTVTWPFQASSSCIPCHIFFYWTRLNISYRDIYDVLFKVFFYSKNGWISQKNLIYAAYLRFLGIQEDDAWNGRVTVWDIFIRIRKTVKFWTESSWFPRFFDFSVLYYMHIFLTEIFTMCFSKYCSMPKMVEFHREISYMRVPVKCETKRNETDRNEM
jgi:hypothetical protein